MVEYNDVCLLGQEQAEGVNIGRADGRPVRVNDRDLGVQETPVVFENMDAGTQQLSVKCLRGIVEQAVLDAPLQQDGHLHTTLCRITQRAPETAAGQEIGVGDQDVLTGIGDCRQVGFFNVASMPEVVPYQKGGDLLATR